MGDTFLKLLRILQQIAKYFNPETETFSEDALPPISEAQRAGLRGEMTDWAGTEEGVEAIVTAAGEGIPTAVQEYLTANPPAGGTVRAGFINDALQPFHEAYLQDPATVRIAGMGDSTWFTGGGDAVGIPNWIKNEWSLPGQPLEGFNYDANYGMFGNNGMSLEAYLADPSKLAEIVAFNPHLLFFGYLINDVRESGETKAQMLVRLRPLLRQAIEQLRAALPNTPIVAVQPSPFLSANAIGFYSQAPYNSVAEAAQAKSETLYELYAELQGQWDNVLVDMQQDTVFGRIALPSHPLMHDEIHRKHAPMLNQLVKLIGVPRVFKEDYARAAIKANYTQPWTVYPRVVELEDYFELLGEGVLIGQGGNYFDVFGDAPTLRATLREGDVAVLGQRTVFVMSQGYSVVNSEYLRVTGVAIPVNTVGNNAPVQFYRHRFAFNSTAEPYLKNTASYPYRRLVRKIAADTGYLIVSEETPLGGAPTVEPRYFHLEAGDVLVSNGVEITLPADFSTQSFNNTSALRINAGGVAFGGLGEQIFIFGNHAYEDELILLGNPETTAVAPTHRVLSKLPGGQQVWLHVTLA